MAKLMQKEHIILDKKYVEELKRKASLFEEILSFLEDEYLGNLMKETEKEKKISYSRAKRFLNR